MKRNSIILLIVALLLGNGVLAANGTGDGGSADKDTLSPVTLDIYMVGDEPNHSDEVWANVAEMSKADLNAEFNVMRASWGEYAEKILLLAASGDKYEMHFDANWFVFPKLLKNDSLLDIDAMMAEYAPNLKSFLTEKGYLAWAYVDDRLLAVPWSIPYNTRPSATIRTDLMAKYGLEGPVETIEDLEVVIETIKAEEPDMRAITAIGKKPDPHGLLRATLCKYGMDNDVIPGFFYFTYDIEDYLDTGKIKVVPLEQTEAYAEAAYKRKEWYEKGWITRNALNDDEKGFKLQDGTAICQIDNFSGAFNKHPGVETGGWLMYPESPAMQATSMHNAFAFNANAEDPERALMFLEWLNASQANYDSVVYGIEGLTYNLVQENGQTVVKEAEGETGSTFLKRSGVWSFWSEKYMYPGDGSWMPDYVKYGEPQLTDPEFNHISPLAGFSFDTSAVKNEVARREAVWDDYGVRLAFGLAEDTAAGLATLIQQQKDAGMEKVRAELQRQIDAFMAK